MKIEMEDVISRGNSMRYICEIDLEEESVSNKLYK